MVGVEMKLFSVKVIKLGRRATTHILVTAASEPDARKRAEDELGARWGIISATEQKISKTVDVEVTGP